MALIFFRPFCTKNISKKSDSLEWTEHRTLIQVLSLLQTDFKALVATWAPKTET